MRRVTTVVAGGTVVPAIGIGLRVLAVLGPVLHTSARAEETRTAGLLRLDLAHPVARSGRSDWLRVPTPRSTTVDVSAGRASVALPDGDYAVTGDVSAGTRTVDVRADPASPSALDVQVSAGRAEVSYAR